MELTTGNMIRLREIKQDIVNLICLNDKSKIAPNISNSNEIIKFIIKNLDNTLLNELSNNLIDDKPETLKSNQVKVINKIFDTQLDSEKNELLSIFYLLKKPKDNDTSIKISGVTIRFPEKIKVGEMQIGHDTNDLFSFRYATAQNFDNRNFLNELNHTINQINLYNYMKKDLGIEITTEVEQYIYKTAINRLHTYDLKGTIENRIEKLIPHIKEKEENQDNDIIVKLKEELTIYQELKENGSLDLIDIKRIELNLFTDAITKEQKKEAKIDFKV